MASSDQDRYFTWAGAISVNDTVNLPFHLDDDDDLVILARVDATGVITVWVKGTDYSVTTGTVPVLKAITTLAVNNTLYILRRTLGIQGTDLVSKQKLPADAMELALDKLARSVVDLQADDLKGIHAPDEEQANATDFELPTSVDRELTYMFFDGTGAMTFVAGISDIGSATISANGLSLIASTFAGMNILLGTESSPVTTQGDIIVTDSSAEQIRLPAPTAPGLVLSTNPLNLSEETAEGSDFEPVWARPETHPFIDVQGFECSSFEGADQSIRIGQGVARPMFRTGASGALNDYNTDGKEMTFNITTSTSWRINTSAGWTAGDNQNKMADGFSRPTAGVLHLFVMGRSADNAVDFCFGANINGTDVVATSDIQTWHNSGGGGKLFLRRVRSLRTTSSAFVAFTTNGNRMIFISGAGGGTINITDSSATASGSLFLVPGEPVYAEIRLRYVPDAAGDEVSIMTLQNKDDAPGGTDAAIIATSVNPEIMYMNHLVGTDDKLWFRSNIAGDGTDVSLAIKSYEDPRGRYLVEL